jgi:hypothetical protein
MGRSVMKLLVGIETCAVHAFSNQQVRDTWLKNCLVDYRFFFGHYSGVLKEDEISLPIADGHSRLMQKTILQLNWVLDHGYDFHFRCHTDTYVHLPRLLASEFELHDWTGKPLGGPGQDCTHPMIYGGSGSWYSRRAMEFLVSELRRDPNQHNNLLAEDWRVGKIFENHILRNGDDRYRDGLPGPAPENDFITTHPTFDGSNLRIWENLLKIHEIASKINTR